MRGARTVLGTTRLEEHRMSAGFSARSLRQIGGRPLDPILSVDEFRMSEPTFPPHPHAGFSAVTYLFEDSKGSFTNRDSLGDRSVIGPGALHWTQAARGMMHEEIPAVPGVEGHGIQMFVNLRATDKAAAPRAFHVAASEVPEVERAGARVRVLAGELEGARSPLRELLTPILFLDVHLAPGAALHVPVPANHTAFVLAISGAGAVGPDGATRPLAAHEAATFADDGDALALAAGPAGLELLVLAGEPIGEPVIFGGPFAMTSRAEIQDAFARYERGEMGRLAPSFTPRR
jgi:redox-sensitive bicupin YhaK (pirin superfamily)